MGAVLKALGKVIEKNACAHPMEKKAAIQKTAETLLRDYVRGMITLEKRAAIGFGAGGLGSALAGLPGKAWGHMKNLPGLVTEDLGKYITESPNLQRGINFAAPAAVGAGVGAATADEGESKLNRALGGAAIGAGLYGGAKGISQLAVDSPALTSAVSRASAGGANAALSDRALAKSHELLTKIKHFSLGRSIGEGATGAGNWIKGEANARAADLANRPAPAPAKKPKAKKPAAEAPKTEAPEAPKAE